MYASSTVLFEEVYVFGDLDVMSTFRVTVDQPPLRPWRITGVEMKTRHGAWEPLIPGTPLDIACRFYAQGEGEPVIEDALEEDRRDIADLKRDEAIVERQRERVMA